ncbi:transcriptional repressor [Patescibacteria group bacterium]|nr:transcriptional repressor [Patescibacteria group bacterium]
MKNENILKAKGYKITRPRVAVLDLLTKQTKPLSVKEIFVKLKREHDLASIYRILKLLEEVEITFAEAIGGEKYYHLGKDQHHHIVCQKCGHVECLPCNHLFNKIKNFTNIKHQLTLTGVCNKCNNN